MSPPSLPTGDVQVHELSTSRRDIERFLRVPYAIYRNDPLWVAPLLADLRQVFDRSNPFFEHAAMRLWVATSNGADIGRIAAMIDRNYNALHQERTAFFGFFECVADTRASRALFSTSSAWAHGQGMQRLLGPMNPSTNDECGLLVEGFDSSPVFMMPYNPRYYADLALDAGFTKAKDLLAFGIPVGGQGPSKRLDRVATAFRKRNPETIIRPIAKKTLTADIAKIKEVYNAAWEANWGFVPMTEAEIDFMAKRLKPLLTEGLAWLAETPQEPVGFMLALPDFNEPMKPLRGRLLTPRLLGFLPYVLGWKRPATVRVITLGVKKSFRLRGIESAMLAESFKRAPGLGIQFCEASWVLEDNIPVQRLIEAFGGRPYKTYRLYERDLMPV